MPEAYHLVYGPYPEPMHHGRPGAHVAAGDIGDEQTQILCVDFNCLQAAHSPTASVIDARCPAMARAETTPIGATPIFRERHIAQRATPRMASATASASVLMSNTIRIV